MSPIGTGFLFGQDVVTQVISIVNVLSLFITISPCTIQFIEYSIDMICRAHQLAMKGFKWRFVNLVLTVRSARNYCYRYV